MWLGVVCISLAAQACTGWNLWDIAGNLGIGELATSPLGSFDNPKKLKLITEGKFEDILQDLKGIDKFEASAVTQVGDNYYIIFDNLLALASVDVFDHRASSNRLMLGGDPKIDSGYEGLQYDVQNDHFYFLVEADDKQPLLDEVQIVGHDVNYLQVCTFEFEFTHENKGFEGLLLGQTSAKGGPTYVFALCEGNNCSGGKKSRKRGHGRIKVFRKIMKGNQCEWLLEREIELPSHVRFQDYSGLDFDGKRLAITSQEDAIIWMVDATMQGTDLHFASDGGVFYEFPRNYKDKVVYCNVEGIKLNGNTVVVVSDKFKKKKQHHRCHAKDQSIHRFAL